jgi:hypothetical protein
MGLSNPHRDMPKPNLVASDHFGYVVDNNDPKKRQRVKIRIPQLHRGIPDSDLPWCMPIGEGHAQSGAGVGSVNVPNNGALLRVSFSEDDPHNPKYGGSPTVDEVHKDNELLNEDYPATHGSIDAAGNKLSINKQRNEVLWQHKSGAYVFIDGAGNISISSTGTTFLNSPAGVNIVSGGEIKLHGSGTDIKGGDVKLNNSGAVTSSSTPPPRTTPSVPNRGGNTGA